MKKESGVIFISEQREKQESIVRRWGGLLILLLYYYIGTAGCTMGLLSIFPVSFDPKILWGGILLLGLFFLLIGCTGRYAPLAVVVSAAAYGWLLYKNWTLLIDGAGVLGETMLQTFQYYRGGQQGVLTAICGYESQTALCILAFTFLWSSLLFAGLMLKGGRFFCVLDVAVVFAAGLVMGKLPDLLSMSVMILGMTGAFSTEGLEYISGQKEGTLLLSALTILLMAAGIFFVEPMIAPAFANELQLREDMQNSTLGQKLNQKLADWTSGQTRMGVNDGELKNAEFLDLTDDAVLRVTTDLLPQEMSYLKFYTGTDYTGREWAAREDLKESQVNAEYYQEIAQVAQQNLTNPMQLKLQIIQKEGDRVFRPYFSSLEKREGELLYYQYFFRNDVSSWYWNGSLPAQGKEEYRSYVYQHYLAYPEKDLQRLKQVCEEHPQENVSGIAAFITSYLREQASYNLNVGELPEDQEFTEYFLFEKHEGYCVHFATAATLMFRMYGIPSRYVTGYVTSPDSFQYENGLYTATVLSRQAHAWTEIYINGQGWIPIETTPGYEATDTLDAEESQNPLENQTERQTETQTQEKKEQPPAGATQNTPIDEGFSMPVWIQLLINGTALVLLLGIALKVFRIWRRRKRARAGVKELFRDICQMLAYVGFTEELEEEKTYVQQAVKACDWLDEEEFARLVHLAMQANFGREAMTKEETLFAQQMYRKIQKQVEKSLHGFRKIQFHLIQAF